MPEARQKRDIPSHDWFKIFLSLVKSDTKSFLDQSMSSVMHKESLVCFVCKTNAICSRNALKVFQSALKAHTMCFNLSTVISRPYVGFYSFKDQMDETGAMWTCSLQ